MFRNATRALRPVAQAVRSTPKTTQTSFRTFATTARVSSGGPPPPQLYGDGGKAGQVPTDIEQATGLERLQLLAELEGFSVFDDSVLDASRLGTKANPVKVLSYDVERIIGCTGVPADSHDIHWFTLKKEENGRCTECGSVYALDFQGEEHHDHHHH